MSNLIDGYLSEYRSRLDDTDWFLSMLPASAYRSKRVLDIGSGSGQAILGLFARGAEACVGVEPEPFLRAECQRDLPQIPIVLREEFEKRLAELDVHRERVAFVEGYAGSMAFSPTGFDVCTCMDVLEHASDVRALLGCAMESLNPGGAEGHHLPWVFPRAQLPWGHLYRDSEDLLEATWKSPYFETEYRNLNRITSGQILEIVKEQGWEVENVHLREDRVGYDLAKPHIDLRKVPAEQDLFIDLIQLVLRKPTTRASKGGRKGVGSRRSQLSGVRAFVKRQLKKGLNPLRF